MVNPSAILDRDNAATNRTTILVATELTERSLSLLQSADGITVQVVSPSPQNIREGLKEASALIIRDDVPVDAHILEHAPHL